MLDGKEEVFRSSLSKSVEKLRPFSKTGRKGGGAPRRRFQIKTKPVLLDEIEEKVQIIETSLS